MAAAADDPVDDPNLEFIVEAIEEAAEV